MEMAKVFLRGIVRLLGLPATIVSDEGPRFALTSSGEMSSGLGFDRRISIAFHPQMDGQTEQMNATMEQNLRVFISPQQDEWVQWLPLAECAANTGISETTKCTLFFAVQAMDPQMSFAGEPTKEQDHP